MRVFVTGAAGFIGSVLVPELLSAGHSVLGLARNDANAKKLTEAGVEVLRGDLTDLASLRAGAEKSDAVVHLAFIHDFSKFAENCAIDKAAIEAIGEVLAGTEKPLLTTGGLALMADGRSATEDDQPSPRLPRESEAATDALAQRGIRASTMRLPQVHDPVKQGLITYVVQIAREKGVSAYVGEGLNRWPAAHVLDVAHLYRLALEKMEQDKGETGRKYHAVAEEGVTMREIAEVLGEGLKVPVVSISPEEAQAHFGWMAMFAGLDMPATSELTRQRLGWNPTGPGMIADLKAMKY
ncbi:SDR family oxidoreductase [Terracidiphilus gabretensis]|jgi:nucleoside-diphosphate-sugar epimerase|uniref:SDR family oxidoreductase n=1 Tax=Terracidiphilus gabretensis TaxID=1577687 RepID=UPI00071BA633|nr:SDR family oxidoreductase [Terracidiphilus gabretensis]